MSDEVQGAVCTPGPKILRRETEAFALPATPAAHAGGFDVPTSLVGHSNWLGSDGKPVTVYYDPALGANGLAIAQYVLANIDALMAFNDRVFGIKGQGGNAIVCTVQGGGAYHYGCDFTSGGTWYADASGGKVMTFGLVQAEVTESYMGLQAKGWNCGGSGGEGLSRLLAEIVSGGPGGALSGFSSGPSWTGADWVSKDQGTDGDYPSIGCAILYLYMMLKTGYTVDQIVQAGESDGTLAGNFATLTGKAKSMALPALGAAVAAVGGPGHFKGDNPFNAPVPEYPGTGAPPPPPPPPVPSKLPTRTQVDALFKFIESKTTNKSTLAILKAVNRYIDQFLPAEAVSEEAFVQEMQQALSVNP